MKTLITHINPHLDDIAAAWLFLRFHPDFKDAKIEFIPAENKNLTSEETEGKIFIGIGRGRFDEHKGDTEDCATSLVWKYLKSQSFIPKDDVTLKSLEELVEWTRIVDLGRLPMQEYDDFIIPAFIRSLGNTQESSLKDTNLGLEILDRVLEILKRKYHGLKDWENRIEFTTRFGKSYAVESETVNRAFCKSQGGDMFLMYDPKTKYVQYFTPVENIDLEPIYHKVKELDPEADWFLHQSHHMVICGTNSAPDVKKTKLSFEQLTEAAKNC